MKTYIIIVVSVLLFGLKLFAGEPVKKFPDNLVKHIDGIQSYPNDAKNYGIQGFVDVVFKVDKNGELKVKEIFGTNNLLVEHVEDELRKIQLCPFDLSVGNEYKVRFKYSLL